MDELTLQEQFEMDVLSLLNSERVLPSLIFCGGTMLRLCYELDRYSVDLDFWLPRASAPGDIFSRTKAALQNVFELTDEAEKFNTLLFELRSPRYPRRLKVEIRKTDGNFQTEPAIAFSRFGPAQVPVTALALRDVMRSKLDALLARREPRDAFDIEFLIRRGVPLEVSASAAEELLKAVGELGRNEINAKLGPLLAPEIRGVYRERGFAFLEMKLKALTS